MNNTKIHSNKIQLTNISKVEINSYGLREKEYRVEINSIIKIALL